MREIKNFGAAQKKREAQWSNGPGGEALPYENDRGARRKFLETPLKGTIMSFFVGAASNSFTPLTGTNSEITKQLPMI